MEPREPDSSGRESYRRQRQEAATSRRISRATYAQLRADIRDGAIPPSSRLDEGTLVANYYANRNAIRRALQMLAQDGLVDRRARTGTMVTSAIVEFSATGVLPVGVADQLEVVELDQLVIPMPDEVARRLQSDAAEVLAFGQLGRVAGTPLYLRSGYAPSLMVSETFFEQVEDTDRSGFKPMEVAFLSLFGVPLGAVESLVEWIPADEDMAAQLEVEPGAPVLQREMVMFGADGGARELSFTYFRGDRVSLSAERSYDHPADTALPGVSTRADSA